LRTEHNTTPSLEAWFHQSPSVGIFGVIKFIFFSRRSMRIDQHLLDVMLGTRDFVRFFGLYLAFTFPHPLFPHLLLQEQAGLVIETWVIVV
jgi:hypothetical protein